MTSRTPGDGPPSDASRPEAGTSAAPSDGDEAGGLPGDVEELLVRLGRAVQRHGLYPPGHPALDPILSDLSEALGRVLDARERVAVGVGPDRLVHEDGESAPGHALLSSLAARLHEHHVSRVAFRPDVGRDELSAFLAEAARSPEEAEEALGLRPELTDEWPHVVVEPVRYESFSMAEEAVAESRAGEEIEEEAEDLWVGLARSALADEALDGLDGDRAPSLDTLVTALSGVTADRARARAVAARMVALARTFAPGEADGTPAVQEQFLELLVKLGPRDLGELLSAAPEETRREFVASTVDWLPPGHVVELVGELTGGRGLDVSYQMLRLLSKLASYAELDSDTLDPEAGAAFSEQVKRLVTGWRENIALPTGTPEGEEEDGTGEAVADPVEGSRPAALSGPRAGVLPRRRSFVDPARVLRTAIEAGSLGPVGREAIDELTREERTGEVLEVLLDAPGDGDAVEAAWEAVDVPAAVGHLLGRSPPDFEAIDVLVERRGGAAGPLLDVLSEAESRSVRRKLFSRLAELEGEDVERAILERLGDERWYVKRNMLALLVERDALPDLFEPLPYTGHSRAEVRKEAYKLAFRTSSVRAEAVRRALADPDRRALSLGLGELRSMPDAEVDEVVPQLRERLEDDELPPGLARQIVHALGRSETEEALGALLDVCRSRKVWRFWAVDLAEKSRVVLEGLEALARSWSDRPEARRVLARAREADDPEIREAARAGSEAA